MVGVIAGGAIWASVILAPNYTPVDHYVAHWEQEEITVEALEEYRQILDTIPGRWWLPEIAFQVPQGRVSYSPQGSERWRSLIEAYFEPEDVAWALRVMQCESQGDPNAKNSRSTASGLFQFLRGWWSGSWGYPAFDPFDPEANVKAAAWLYYTEGPHHWVCK